MVNGLSVFEVGLIQPIVDRNDGDYSYFCDLNVTFDIPTGLTFANIKLSYPVELFWGLNKTMRQYRVRGVLIQLNEAGNMLKTSSFDVGSTSPFIDTPASGVAKIKCVINEILVRVRDSTGLYFFDRIFSSDFTILNIDLLDSGGSSLLTVSIKQSYLLFTFKTPTEVSVSSETPIYVLTLECPTTKQYIGGWGYLVKSVTGSPSEGDTVKLELLDGAGNVLVSDVKPVLAGQLVKVAQNINAVTLRVTLNATSNLIVNGDVLTLGKWV